MSQSNPHNITPGQILWFVPDHNRREPEKHVTIAAIGRTWAALTDRRRVLLKTLEVEGYGNGRCHLSREAYEAGQVLDEAWRTLYLPITRPAHITAEDIAAIRASVEGES